MRRGRAPPSRGACEGAGRGTSQADGRGCNTCALQAANGRGAGQGLRCVQAPRVVVGCRLQRAKRGGLQRGSERRQPLQPASQASCRALQRAPHWHVTGTSSVAVAASCHMSRITRQPSHVASKSAFVCVAACAWWRVALKRVSAAAHHNHQPSTPLSLHGGGVRNCSTSYLFYMRFRYRISDAKNHDVPLVKKSTARAERAQEPSLNKRR